MWDAQTGAELLTLKGHTGTCHRASFSPDGTRIVTGSEDKTAKVWDAKTGAELLTLKGHTDSVSVRVVQPGRHADRHRQSGQDGEGVGRPAGEPRVPAEGGRSAAAREEVNAKAAGVGRFLPTPGGPLTSRLDFRLHIVIAITTARRR